jgi:hypothetical protein
MDLDPVTDPDPDPVKVPDPCGSGSGSTTLVKGIVSRDWMRIKRPADGFIG